MEYTFSEIEQWAKAFWKDKDIYKVTEDTSKPKYYVLDMFPYPSGAGLHVGHPLGYIASDIYARYKRLKGFNVLHPMGYDSFGLPAEQYAIQTGQHPALTTEQNIARYREQLDKIGFCFDWSREVRTSAPQYYKWTQWIFLQIFKSWYNRKTDKAENIDTLIAAFEKDGNTTIDAVCSETKTFSADAWKAMDERAQQEVLMNYRLAYLDEAYVNWCPAMGTVLANDEVKDGVSERGGYPVERKLMKQWSMRITAYADRLLNGLDTLDWSEAIKETQRNWIGRSEGAMIRFDIAGSDKQIEVFTTRPDTIFGVTYVTLAPEHELINSITTPDQREKVEAYVTYAKNRSERERMTDVKKVTGQFTGAYVVHPFTHEKIPVWIGEYVLAGYGTGAVMAVPAHDSRDYAFAKHFNLPIKEVVSGGDISKEAFESKDEGTLVNSDFLNGLNVKQAIKKAIEEIDKKGIGKGRINFKLRDAVFGRQRYWGEPIPIYYKDGIPYPVDEKDLPVVLPEVDKYLPTETGEPPLARATDFQYNGFEIEKTTMPGWAGSSWYFLRYMDPHNEHRFAGEKALAYWKDIDLYVGGSEHGTGHLLYFRFWTKFLKDLGYINIEEPAKKLVNQGMIQGVSQKIFHAKVFAFNTDLIKEHHYLPGSISIKDHDDLNLLLSKISFTAEPRHSVSLSVSAELLSNSEDFYTNNVLVDYVENGKLNINKYINYTKSNSRLERVYDILVCKNGYYVNDQQYKYDESFEGNIDFYTKPEVEKMSKSKWNVISPDEVIDRYGADGFRMYEMFLGPIELSKPWDTQGIDGVSRFLRKFWRLFYDEQTGWIVTDDAPTAQELKILHKTIKKIEEDIERLSFNTSVSAFMMCVNELTELQCHKKAILEPLCILLHSFAPHVTEYLYSKLTNTNTSIANAAFPKYDAALLVENSFEYPVSVNGKLRTKMEFALDMPQTDIEQAVLANDTVQKWLEGKAPKKIIYVKGRMINIVV